ncbi:Z1 domain-containing protein [Parenemella sanctibonifatiensis]|uniref:Endonuclease n=1 Tax=Parenemella sanctibonifatiensis TaxID=2016505 RepID=A0A255EBA9_9ACTN|nr:Z1 domain-containing protein [Parenemella sanctibonifatiensis]OYN88857.1 endonuclease [Parenemella sanctibonifatiensis]
MEPTTPQNEPQSAIEADIEELLLTYQRAHRLTVDEAAQKVGRLGVGTAAQLNAVVERLRARAAQMRMLDSPIGVSKEHLADDLKAYSWYTGPTDSDQIWRQLRNRMRTVMPDDAVADIDTASTKVVGHLANPFVRNLRTKGLVIGHVQSGKTANYAAVIAKAADQGYRLVIVLAGLHNNLRRQTQQRLDRDLGTTNSWVPLTDEDHDFGAAIPGTAMMTNDNHILAVIKKNPRRLEHLRNWLRDIDREIRERAPILIIDDEADQATPNSSKDIARQSRINELIREIWAEVASGSYVGYTATPFANIFMDPTDKEELYPEDFIVELPRGRDYFGAEEIFGRSQVDEDDSKMNGMDVVRIIPAEDEASLRVPKNIDSFQPEIVDSLADALRWFILSTAIRRARSDHGHSSMLIHATHRVGPHFRLRTETMEWLAEEQEAIDQGRTDKYEALWLAERARAAEVATRPMPDWRSINQELARVISDCQVIVDNGTSQQRLSYSDRDEEGQIIPQTVIAIGGGTLSRGLTLEGLVVSYFLRSANTYDTLLQMGRWFGYRQGYEDLPRIWTTPKLQEHFTFLATVEEELRREVRTLAANAQTPRQVGVRIRTHPGTLAITADAKMQHAEEVYVSYSGTRLQTIFLHERETPILRGNWALLEETVKVGSWDVRPDGNGWIRRGATADDLIQFLDRYEIHPKVGTIRPEPIKEWLLTKAPDAMWNFVLPQVNSKAHSAPVGDLGPLRLHTRAPLVQPDDAANIKALLSKEDWYIDLPETAQRPEGEASQAGRKKSDLSNQGALILMPIDGASQPRSKTGTRRPMAAPDGHHLLGVGLVFPFIDDWESSGYVAVRPDWEPEHSEFDVETNDTEPDMEATDVY